MRIRNGLGIAVLAGSFTSIAYGLVHSSPFYPYSWPGEGMRILAAYAVFFLAVFGILRWAGRKYRLSLPALLGVSLALVSIPLYGLIPATSVALFLATSLAAGKLALAPWKPGSEPLLPLFCGMAILALLFTWLSPLPLNTRIAHYGLTGLLLAISGAAQPIPWRKITGFFRAQKACPTEEEIIYCGLYLAAALLLLIGTIPEAGYDGLAMHLYIPSYMQGHARWAYDPMRYAFSFMPAAADFIFAHLFLLGGEAPVRLFQMVSLLISLLAMIRLQGTGSRTNLLLASLLFLILPITLLLSVHLFVEATLAMWLAGAAYAIAGNSASPAAARWLALSACVSAACATKLHGAVFAPCALIAGFWLLRPTLRLALIATALVGPGLFPYWYAWLKTGNPVFPFYNDIFHAPYFPIFRFVDNRWVGHLHWSLLYDLTFKSPMFLESSNGILGFTWLALLPAGVWRLLTLPNRYACALAAIAIAPILISSQSVQYIRYLYPFSVLLLPVLAGAIDETETLGGRISRFALVAALLCSSVWLWPTAFDPRPLAPSRIFSQENSDTLVKAQAPARLANLFINTSGDRDPHVLYPEDPTGALLEGTAVYVNWYSQYYNWYAHFAQDDETIGKFLALAEANYVVQPKEPRSPLARALGEYLARTRKPAADIGNLLVYRLGDRAPESAKP